MAGRFKEGWVSQLEVLVKGRENSNEVVDDSVTPGTTVEVLHIQTEQGLVTFKVRADTTCRSVTGLLRQFAEPGTKLQVMPGPRGGLRLGVNGKYDNDLNIFVKK